ncbi:MAG: Rieske 2Fe-2S domain-containing protein [Candidatus Rokubacteria bacterium]|nr:Rieske 2Fe-2S domain-containing protein [Candidatus Rokubacteria bacterium]
MTESPSNNRPPRQSIVARTDPGDWRCAAAALGPSRSAKLRITRAGRVVEAFVVEWAGRYCAYVNRCPHVGTPLDLWPNEFFSEDGRALVCSTHGAVFDPADGRCLAGPCLGDSLTALDVRRDGDDVVVRWRPA